VARVGRLRPAASDNLSPGQHAEAGHSYWSRPPDAWESVIVWRGFRERPKNLAEAVDIYPSGGSLVTGNPWSALSYEPALAGWDHLRIFDIERWIPPQHP
jgi:hypothetical protein